MKIIETGLRKNDDYNSLDLFRILFHWAAYAFWIEITLFNFIFIFTLVNVWWEGYSTSKQENTK